MVNNFLAGLQSAWGAVVSWLTGALANLAAMFPHSPVKEGPLKGYETWGYIFGMGIADGLRRSTGAVQAAMAGLLSSVALPGGSLNLGICGGLSGPSGPPVFFGGSGGSTPIIINHIHVMPPDLYLDGRQLANGVGPHLANEVWIQNAWRRPT